MDNGEGLAAEVSRYAEIGDRKTDRCREVLEVRKGAARAEQQTHELPRRWVWGRTGACRTPRRPVDLEVDGLRGSHRACLDDSRQLCSVIDVQV